MKFRHYKIIVALFLIIGVGLGGVLGYYDARLEVAANTASKKLDDVEVPDDITFDEDVINILLVGSDHGAIKGDHGRSDSIMIATVNLKTKELKLTSLMRDMYVEIPGHGHNKLNAAYAYGGATLLYQTIAQNFGIKINHYCVVDFAAFEKVIDSVGGIDIDIEEKEAEYLNRTNYISKKKNRTLKTGKQTLNGNQALGYSRVRYVVSQKYGDGDFGRTGRQRAVMQATLNKVLEQSVTDIADIALDTLQEGVETDMDGTFIKNLAVKIVSLGTTEIDQMRLPLEGTYTMGRAQSNMFVFFVNFEANKAALEYFLFNKGTEKDWAAEYGGASGVETFGYTSTSASTSSSDSTATSSNGNTSGYSSTSSGNTYSTTESTQASSRQTSTTAEKTQSTTRATTAATAAPTTAAEPEDE